MASDSKTCRLTRCGTAPHEPAIVKCTMWSGSPVCTKYGRPDTSTAACARRLVHRDERVAEPADALLVAQRLRERLAEHDRGVLDGVVALDLDVAHGLHGQVEAGVGAQRGEHVVEERHAGARCRPVRCRRGRARRRCRIPWSCVRPWRAGSGVLGAGGRARVTMRPIRALAVSSASFSSARPMVVRRYPGMPTSRISTPASR